MGAKSDRIKGTAKQIEGKLTRDKVRIAEGTVQRTKGDLEGAATRFVNEVKGSLRRAKAGLHSAGRSRRR